MVNKRRQNDEEKSTDSHTHIHHETDIEDVLSFGDDIGEKVSEHTWEASHA
jgi:hypothetical protein